MAALVDRPDRHKQASVDAKPRPPEASKKPASSPPTADAAKADPKVLQEVMAELQQLRTMDPESSDSSWPI